jgi:hypothetical protein
MSHFIRFRSNPITDYLIDNYQAIRSEYLAREQCLKGLNLLEVQNISNKVNPPITTHERKPLYEGGMVVASVFLQRHVLSRFELEQMKFAKDENERWFMPDINESMPTLKKWIDMHKEHLCSTLFHAAQPGSQINFHYGPDSNRTNFRLHLCLTDDPGCVFNIENELHTWKEGELFAFDDAFVYHGIKHRGTKPRIIIAIDVKKTALYKYAINWERRAFIPRLERTVPVIKEW